MLTYHAHHSGVVTLIKDYTVCSAGDTLTPEQCRVLVRDSCMQLVVYVCMYILYTPYASDSKVFWFERKGIDTKVVEKY